jgi:tetratricopeptide (TPR) repeat protein
MSAGGFDRSRAAALFLTAVSLACERFPGASATPARPKARHPTEEARELIAAGQLDAALSKLSEMPGEPDALYYQGVVWARKAEAAPLPTPPPSAAHGAAPLAAAEFKPEELTALDFFEKALAAGPADGRAELALAELLAPHALRWQERIDAGQRGARRARHASPAPPPTLPPGVPDYRTDRVIEAYRGALSGDRSSKQAAEGLARFCVRVGRLDEADAAFRELIQRDKENPENLVRYGDFLASERKDTAAAVEHYRQALIWRPDDDETRGKIADVFIAQGVEYYKKQEYAMAEVRFAEAEKYVTDRSSPRGVRIQDYLGRLRSIRPKAGR